MARGAGEGDSAKGMKKYPTIHAGQRVWVKWRKKDYKMACCDCHLVHRLRFTVVGGHVVIQGWRDNRATAQLRRHRKNN